MSHHPASPVAPTAYPSAVRAEGRSPRQARSPPAWRIETSLRRKRVRGGGSRRARAVRQGPTHLTPARERVASSADLSAPRLAPLGAETQAQHVNATASCRETATRSAPGPAQEDRRVRSGHARLPEPWRQEMEGWSAAGALAGGGGSSGVAGARGGVNVLHAPAGPARAPPLRSGTEAQLAPPFEQRAAGTLCALFVARCSLQGQRAISSGLDRRDAHSSPRTLPLPAPSTGLLRHDARCRLRQRLPPSTEQRARELGARCSRSPAWTPWPNL